MSYDDESNIEEFSDEAKDFLSTLTPREAEILRERFNIDMTSGVSPAKELEQLKHIQKRIREVEEKARRKDPPKFEGE